MTKSFKIGGAISLGIVTLITILFIRIGSLKDATQVQTQEIYRLEWLLSAKEAENDTLKAIGQYSKPDTVWRKKPVKIIYRDSLHVDTVYEDIPDITGSIKIDTTKELGPDSNPMSIRVVGEFWYPSEYSYRNWMLIHPVIGKPPYLPVARRSPPRWGTGLACAISLDGTGNLGIYGRSGKASLAVFWTPEKKRWMIGGRYAILEW